jgi:hypothetical protein
MLDRINVVCYKWGTRYDALDVNVLYASMKRNISVPMRFFCITDDASGLRSEIEAVPIIRESMVGNGAKLYTFSEGALGLGSDEYLVCIDLDMVVVDSLDFLLERPEKQYIVAQHRNPKSISRAHTAVYRVKVGSHREFWDKYIENPAAAAARFPGRKDVNAFSDQKWMEDLYRGRDFDFFPFNKVILFRRDCEARAPSFRLGEKAGRWLSLAMFGEARLPGEGEAIVSFAGLTKPRDVIDHYHLHLRRAPFVQQFWHE